MADRDVYIIRPLDERMKTTPFDVTFGDKF